MKLNTPTDVYFLFLSNFTDMVAIYAAFNRQEIACPTPTVKDSGCANNPNVQPVVTTTVGNSRVRLDWQSVPNATGYQVFRADGGVLGCYQGKALLTATADPTKTTTSNTYLEDSGLQNGREVSMRVGVL